MGNNQYESQTQQKQELDPRIVLPREEFFRLGYDDRRRLMKYWRENYNTKYIMEHMQYNNSTSLYKVIRRLGLPTDMRKEKDKRAREQLAELPRISDKKRLMLQEVAGVGKDTPSVEVEESPIKNIIKPFSVKINGSLGSEELANVLNMCVQYGLHFTIEQSQNNL